jgi:DNA end-binding protein Ku
MGTLLRYPYEVRSEKDYFDDIQDVKITKDMLDLAKHIVDQKTGKFEPEKFEDHYEAALVELLNKKNAGQVITAPAKSRTSGNVIDLMDALRNSLKDVKQPASTTKPKKGKKRAAGQGEMLLPISGKGGAKVDRKKAEKPSRSTARSRKAG